jgi:glycogen debranching enzyme
MKEESPQPLQDYSILATASRPDERTRVVKDGETFGVFDHSGMIRHTSGSELGLYHEGTRFLSNFELALERRHPLLLGSTVRRDNVLVVDLANPDLPDGSSGPLVRDTVHMFVSGLLWDRAWYGRVRLQSYVRHPLELELSFLFAADYADIFEVRGIHRIRRGRDRAPAVFADHVRLGYDGLDHVSRSTTIKFSPMPDLLTASRASYRIQLDAHGETELEVRAAYEVDGVGGPLLEFDDAHQRSLKVLSARRAHCGTVQTSNARFDEWIDRSAADLQMMITETTDGPYPYAGVPWFSSPFGRDGIITAFETLWMDQEVARGVLNYLAANQATEFDPENDAEPGKIIHEARQGEMPALREVPFGRYYGSIDATPLFVMLAGAYWRRSADFPLVEAIWPNVERALAWIDRHGDLDGDGFVEYARRSPTGLAAQGWKDSFDSISHQDGELARGPVALCEVQGYVYAARRSAAELARVLGHRDRADVLERQAENLRDQFERTFWCDELGTYALALDGDKRPCRVRASNAGHCLFTGIASAPHARRVVETLLDDCSFSGWGIRTLDAGEQRYNPISYHNGSVWPHDNAIIAMGMARYGHKHASARILSGLFAASVHFDLRQMPELFCGFRQRPDEGPTHYPVACVPQAWAAGSVFLALQACLGLDIDALGARIMLDHPLLPEGVDRVMLRNLRVGAASVDVVLDHRGGDVGVHLERSDGTVELVIVK